MPFFEALYYFVHIMFAGTSATAAGSDVHGGADDPDGQSGTAIQQTQVI